MTKHKYKCEFQRFLDVTDHFKVGLDYMRLINVEVEHTYQAFRIGFDLCRQILPVIRTTYSNSTLDRFGSVLANSMPLHLTASIFQLLRVHIWVGEPVLPGYYHSLECLLIYERAKLYINEYMRIKLVIMPREPPLTLKTIVIKQFFMDYVSHRLPVTLHHEINSIHLSQSLRYIGLGCLCPVCVQQSVWSCGCKHICKKLEPDPDYICKNRDLSSYPFMCALLGERPLYKGPIVLYP